MASNYTVGEVARIAGVTIRALRHYDRIGLLVPATRTDAGYRLYTDDDLLTLQLILIFRALDFSLETISRLLQHPAHRRQEALELQAELLEKRAEHFTRLARLARKTLADTTDDEPLSLQGGLLLRDAANEMGGTHMSKEALFDGLEPEQILKDQEQYEQEVQERWGKTEAYRISKKRTARYQKEDWARIQKAAGENLAELVACHAAGVAVEDPRMMAVCDTARAQISEFYYPCSLEIFAGLGQMYVADERFTAFYNQQADGLAEYYSRAIAHYCDQSLRNASEGP